MLQLCQWRLFSTVFYFQVKREKIWFKTCLLSVWVCKMSLRICLQNISFIFWGVCEKNIFWGVCEIFIFWGVCENIIFWGVCEICIFWDVRENITYLLRGVCEEQFRYHNLSLLPLLPPANGFPLFLQLQLWFLHVLYVSCPKHSHSACVAPESNYFVVLRF